MSINLNKNDQSKVLDIAKQFIQFYYQSLNDKKFIEISKYIKNYTIYSIENQRYKGHFALEKLQSNINENDMEYTINSFDAIHSGARRINILIIGVIKSKKHNIEKTFSEYIHMGQGNDKKFWIQTSIFKLI